MTPVAPGRGPSGVEVPTHTSPIASDLGYPPPKEQTAHPTT